MTYDETPEVTAFYAGISQFLDREDEQHRKIGNCQHGVYLFYDYDEEPIYVGQTKEKLRTRIRRHLTNQRTDAVAMRILDPFEVAEIEVWPFWDLETADKTTAENILDRAEYTVYCLAVQESIFSAILNEGVIYEATPIDLPPSIRESILPEAARQPREHPDTRFARRARTMADLARIISERKVTIGIRRTLLVQAQRLEHMASERLKELKPPDPDT